MKLQDIHQDITIRGAQYGPFQMYSYDWDTDCHVCVTGINRVETAKKEADYRGQTAFIIRYYSGGFRDENRFQARFSKLGKNWKLEEIINLHTYERVF